MSQDVQTYSISVATSLWVKTDSRYKARSLINISSLRSSDSRRCVSEMLLKTYRLTSASTVILEILQTMSQYAHWNRYKQNSKLRPHGELFRPSVKENRATERTTVALWDKHVCI